MILAFLIMVAIRLLRVYIYLLIAYALLSWFPGAYQSKLGQYLSRLVEPILNPFKGLRLQFLGLDFTVILIIFLINLIIDFLIGFLA